MTDKGEADDTAKDASQPKRPEHIAETLRLRPEPPQVARLSRKVLAGGSACVLVLICGAIFWALQERRSTRPAAEELYATDHHNVADQLATLPKDYTEVPKDVPRLGPPLPGDLGRPIAAAQGSSASPLGMDAEQQRVNQESEAARTSKVFASTNVRPSSAATSANEAPSNGSTSSDEAFAQNGQDRKLAFVSASVDRRTTSPDRLTRPTSPFVVQAGTVVPAALITGIRSDLPGQITAQVTEAVYDSPTGRARLIPQGARLIGTYDSQIAFGQSRVLLVWTRLIMPNGRSIVLERQPGADAAGYSGLEDEVDNHWNELLGAAALSTLLAVGTEVNSGADSGSTNSDVIAALRRGAGDSINQTGHQLARRNLNIQPTLTIRPGFPVRVIVNRDLVLEPYRG
ncbi:TrbI/VirB10 family protein [Bradyrhizobium sp. 4]|uniref:TrbI/VirB10 family protein n=1 Tax=unclassified Bradyrhizobium TaxID=2631580 RepID=UPI001FFB6748|nr:TrbI/VirB10 family protein [Bradyrhizobium sp. 4]MCK1401905.1 TrbI/VirB10 family protein [Bradyrhizobium sp. 39]MCK1634720.1 TrbI/VirB10 family protein [Bradyrhizobium sp. 162]MCK1749449.1 TrbI/VirB10 family protein [Bradyrhizobium sp. 135]UPJ36311.1 TrbI/VirB10 family protein [Bradyrhizobium sp. 4]